MPNRYFKIGILFAFVVIVSRGGIDYHAVPPAHADEAPPAPAPNALLSMDGPGGQVTLGDLQAQAMKAFPARQDAQVPAKWPPFWSSFNRYGWSWSTEKPVEWFEVSLAKGRVVGIGRGLVIADEKSRTELIETTIRKLGQPTAQATGKSLTIYGWDMKPSARFLIDAKQGMAPGGGSAVVTFIGSRDELKTLGFAVENLKSLVATLDADSGK